MRPVWISRSFVMIAAAAVSACGGGGGSGTRVVSTPPPPTPAPTPTPTPTPTPPAILSLATTSQEFASKGVSYPISLARIMAGMPVPAPRIGDSDQLKLRYDAASNTYEIRLPGGQDWLAITPVAGSPNSWSSAGGAATLTVQPGGSAALISWSGSNFGVTAVGIPAPSRVQSRGVFNGTLTGFSSEKNQFRPGTIGGTIHLTYGIGSAELTGSISPTLTLAQNYTLPTLNFKDTVLSRSTATFSGSFDTQVAGLNSFSGIFAGSTANQMIGSFAFPYLSPVNGSAEQAGGAFIATERPLPEP